MLPILTALPTLGVSAVYCLWNMYEAARRHRERKLRQRVAFMLWVAATEVE